MYLEGLSKYVKSIITSLPTTDLYLCLLKWDIGAMAIRFPLLGSIRGNSLKGKKRKMSLYLTSIAYLLLE